MKIFKGKGVANGIIKGRIILYLAESFINVEPRRITKEQIDHELKRFDTAIVKSKKQLSAIKSKVKKTLGISEANIFHSQILILQDNVLINKVIKYIEEDLINAEYAVVKTIKGFVKELEKTDNTYLRERVIDFEDIKNRLLKNMGTGLYETEFRHTEEPTIAVAQNITASDSIELINMGVKALVLEKGGATSHSAILARAMGVPTVMGIDNLINTLIEERHSNDTWDKCIVDAYRGKVIVDPDEKTCVKYDTRIKNLLEKKKLVCEGTALPAKMTCGYEVPVYANIGANFGIEDITCDGAGGVGLYRTEFQYMLRKDFPDEEALFRDYSEVLKMLKEKPVTIRLLDIGGDKFLPYYNHPVEKNPELGERSIRFLFKNMDILRTQLRAILRASRFGSPRIMLPMIASVEEIQIIRKIISEEKEELEREHIEYRREYVPVGIMVEVPAVVFNLHKIAQYVDFFSIGSNDLMQYTLAIDRESTAASDLYTPSHPAMLEMIAQIAEISNDKKVELSFCGEMASEIKYIPAILGLGVNILSMNRSNIKDAKEFITKLNLAECKELGIKLRKAHTSKEIENLLNGFLREKLKKLTGV